MSVFGICRCKDEADIIEATVRRMAGEVDHLMIVDNASTDGTYETLLGLSVELPLSVGVDLDVGYLQSLKMSQLAALAADRGADWVIPFDADERWYSPFGRIADVLAEHPEASIVGAELYDHVPTGLDPDSPDPIARMGWRRHGRAPLMKVAVRPRPHVTIHQGNHDADHGNRVDGLLIVRHYPYRSPEQMVRKALNGAAAYAATDLPESVGAHWRQYGALVQAHGEEALHGVFREYFWCADPHRAADLMFDPAP